MQSAPINIRQAWIWYSAGFVSGLLFVFTFLLWVSGCIGPHLQSGTG